MERIFLREKNSVLYNMERNLKKRAKKEEYFSDSCAVNLYKYKYLCYSFFKFYINIYIIKEADKWNPPVGQGHVVLS